MRFLHVDYFLSQSHLYFYVNETNQVEINVFLFF